MRSHRNQYRPSYQHTPVISPHWLSLIFSYPCTSLQRPKSDVMQVWRGVGIMHPGLSAFGRNIRWFHQTSTNCTACCIHYLVVNSSEIHINCCTLSSCWRIMLEVPPAPACKSCSWTKHRVPPWDCPGSPIYALHQFRDFLICLICILTSCILVLHLIQFSPSY